MRLLLVALLVVGCGGTTASAPPTAAAVTPSPTKTPGAPLIASAPIADPDACELAIDIANHLMSVLVEMADAIGDPTAMDPLVNETTDLAEAQLDYLEIAGVDHPSFDRWREIMDDLDASRLPHLTGDDTPFVEAVGAGALYAETLKAACS